jgi:hypothetical protein
MTGQIAMTSPQIVVYAGGGGYYYPTDDMGRLSDEIRSSGISALTASRSRSAARHCGRT